MEEGLQEVVKRRSNGVTNFGEVGKQSRLKLERGDNVRTTYFRRNGNIEVGRVEKKPFVPILLVNLRQY